MQKEAVAEFKKRIIMEVRKQEKIRDGRNKGL